MLKELSKKDIKEVIIEAFEPFSKAVQKDFQKMDARFDKMDARFDKVELRLDNVELDLKEVKQDIKWMKENSSELFAKLDKFIKLYEDQKQELLLFGAHLERLEERVSKLEAE